MARRSRKAKPDKAPARLSIRALAKRLGVSHTAIGKAIASGRLRDSIGHEHGRPFVKDPDLAAKEWAAGTSRPASAVPDPALPEGAPATLTQAQLRVAIQRERQLQLDNELKSGRTIDAVEAKRDAFRAARAVRDSVLNVPDRLAADLAAEVDVDRIHTMLTAELRKALEDAAAIIEALEPEVGAGEADE